MATDYLLPCACGRSHRVSSRQAGDKFVCSCGASLEVPPMRELGQLEPATVTTPVRVKVWGLRQGLMFLGMVIAGVGILIGGFYSLFVMPAPQQIEAPQAWVDEMGVDQARAFWNYYQHGIPRGKLDGHLAFVLQQRDRANRGVHAAWMVIALGGILASVSFLVPRAKLRTNTA